MLEDWFKLTVNKDIISFGNQRIPTRNVASISVVEDPVNKKANLNIGMVLLSFICGALAVFFLIIAAALVINARNDDYSPAIFPGLAGLFFGKASDELYKKRFNYDKRYQVSLLTTGGSLTALTGLSYDFADKVLNALQSAISGNDHRPIYVDARTQEVKVGSVDMSQKSYTATNSPGAVVGDNTNSTISTHVQGVQDIEELMARVGALAATDRGELLKLLIEIRAYLADGSVTKQQARSSYNEFLSRIGKYFSTAGDLVSLVAAIAKFL